MWQDLVGYNEKEASSHSPTFDNAMYLSEAATADRNFCLGYMMQGAGAFMSGTNLLESLTLYVLALHRVVHGDAMVNRSSLSTLNVLGRYFMHCSIEVTSNMMAIVAATLAHGGVNPLTGRRIFEQVRRESFVFLCHSMSS